MNRKVDMEVLAILAIAVLATVLFWSVMARFVFSPLMEYLAHIY